MAVTTKLFQKLSFLQQLKEKKCIQSCNQILYFEINYSQYSTNYPRGVIKNKIVSSPFSNVPVENVNNLNTFLWKNSMMDKTAVVCGVTGTSYTYEKLRKLSQTFGYSLLQQGFKPGQVIATVLQNFIENPVVLLGAIAAGLSVCSINPAYTPDEIKYQLDSCNAVGVVTYLELLPTIREALSKLEKKMKVIVTPGLQNEGLIVDKITQSEFIFYENLLEENLSRNIELLEPNTKSEDLFHISHSSGTTGLPKKIWLSHGNFVNNIIQSTSVPSINLQNFATETHQDVIPLVLPLYHNYALNVILKSLYLRSKIVLLPKFEGQTYLNTLEKYKASVLYLVPPIMQYLISSSKLSSNHTKYLRNVLCAGAPLNISSFHKIFEKCFPTSHFRQGYGLTEGTCFVTLDTLESGKSQSVGIPIPNTQLKITDLQDGSDKDIREEGEICFRGPQMTKGYMNNTKANEEAIDKGGWFHTGDIGYYDEEGYFYVVDRLKDMIKVKGFQVSPTEIEEVLKTHELVIDVAVLGISHPRKGEAPVAFLVIDNKNDKQQLEKQLLKFMETRLASFKKVEKFVFVDTIPKSVSGKILRKELRSLLKVRS